jgi:hypothetical protein
MAVQTTTDFALDPARSVPPPDRGRPPTLQFAEARPGCRVILPASAGTRRSVLAFSHHKAGSTMLFGILRALSKAVGMTYVSIPAELFRRGVDLRAVEVDTDWHSVGYCFAGFRSFPEAPLPLVDTAPTILLVRDPRDAVVSHYFSARDSHQLPQVDGTLLRRMIARRENARSMTVDDWVVENQGAAIEALSSYLAQGFLTRPNVAIYRYEDVIYRKRAWVADILAWFDWPVADDVVDDIVRKFDVFPQKEARDRHIRQVHPGNHRSILKPATCARLDTCFDHFLQVFGYTERDAP